MASAGDIAERVSLDLFVMTYGAIVAQLLDDFEDAEAVNDQLAKMGHSIGKRIADDFFARARGAKCRTFEEAMNTVASRGFPMYLSATPTISFSTIHESELAGSAPTPAAEGDSASEGAGSAASGASGRTLECCTLTLADNPLTKWVEIPEGAEDLQYSGLLCGVIRGALEMLMLRVTADFVADTLKGDDSTVMRVVLREVEKDAAAEEYRAE